VEQIVPSPLSLLVGPACHYCAIVQHFPGMTELTELTRNRITPIVLLFASNIFMTFAWYGHLKYSQLKGGAVLPLWQVILMSWGIAFFEYVLMVPANRWGSQSFTATELKIIQEAITLIVFMGFAATYLQARIRWNHVAAFACIMAAIAFTFLPKDAGKSAKSTAAQTEH
jgi:uncharacterized protein